ncbi:MAG: S9 family peptidase, partial [Acidimicrobiia bacterium]
MHPSTGSVAYVVSGPDSADDRISYELVVAADDGIRHRSAGARGPRWSPDGEHLAYLSLRGSRWATAYRSSDGEIIDLAGLPGDSVEFDWDPRGDRLLVIVSRLAESRTTASPYTVGSALDWLHEPRREMWLLPLDGPGMRLFDETHGVGTARWSPDGNAIAFVTDQGVDRERSLANALLVNDVRSGRTEELVPPVTPLRSLAWSPDGSTIAYLAASRDNASSAAMELWTIDVATRTRRRLAPDLDRSIGMPVRGDDERAIGPPTLQWLDSGSVLAIYAEGGRSRLARFDVAGDWQDLLPDDPCVLEFSVAGSGVAYSWSDSVTPGEVSVLNPETGASRQVSDIGSLTGEFGLAPTTRISTQADDGVEVEGWLTVHPDTPPGAPLVLQVHGGPHYAVGERFSFDAQRLAGRGMAVLRANPRGSHGYGQAFADGNLGDWGGRDFEDLLALVDEAVVRADLDGDRVAIIGESYGGYMAAWAVASSDRFAAAVMENSIADFLSSARGVIEKRFWRSEMAGAPWENPDIYRQRSVITRIDRVKTPVFVIHCEADTTCPVAHGEAVYTALRGLGRDVEFLRVPDEGHFFNVFGALSRRLDRTRALDDFLVQHLQPTDGSLPPPPSREETSL